MLAWGVRCVPERFGAPLCGALGALASVCLPGRRAIAARNLALAWPEGPPVAPAHVFRHLASVGWDFVRLGYHQRDGFACVHPERSFIGALEAAIAEGKGVVVATGHLGSWELVVAGIAARVSVPVHVLVKPLGPLDAWVDRQRRQAGLHTIVGGRGAKTLRPVLRALAAGHIVVTVIDQHSPGSPCVVPLFGRPAATLTMPARVAARMGAALMWVAPARLSDGRHRVAGVRVAVAADGDTHAITADLNTRLEAAIRAHPAQWIWTHRRWKVSTPASFPADGAR